MTNEQLIEAVLARSEDDRKAIMLALVEAMLIGGELEKPTKTRKPKDPSAPKREANWWIKATQYVRSLLADQIKADNEARVAAGDKKLPGTVPTTVASMLKDAGKLSADITPSEDEVLEMYESYKEAPPAPKKASSTASSGSSAKSSKSKYAGMSEEEAEAAKKAARSEAAKKAAATRAANKAKKAAEEAGDDDADALLAEAEALLSMAKPSATAAAAAAAEATTEESDELEKTPITYKGKKYMSLPIEHNDKEMVGIWDLKGKWIGALETEGKKQTLHTDCEDPLS